MNEVPELLPGEDRTLGQGLFVDLIPSRCWFTNVRSCVSLRDWKRLRTMVTERAGQRCEACGAEQDTARRRWLEVHERWLWDDEQCTQTLGRLICLCSDCHQVTHYGLAELRGRGEQALQHLMRVTGMTEQQARTHIRRAFAVWEDRSQQDYDLDLSILTDAGVAVTPPPEAAARAGIAAEELRVTRPHKR